MSVKTGAVGSNPRIDKLMNVNAESLRAFAATSIVSGVLMTPVGSNNNPVSSTTEADSVNHDEAYEKAEDSRKKVRENRDKITIMPELPQEGIYVKDFHKGNIVQRYKKAAEERQMQLQAAATLAFAEKDALIRNGIEEENRNEFFAGYLSLESEYLVEGALLTCSQATNDIKYIDVPDSETGEKYVFEGNEGKTENELLNVKNPANDGEKRYARVSDTVKKENIGIFRNCKLTTDSSASEAKVLGKREECRTYGTCFALMDLCDEWVNVQSGAEYGTADGEKKNCINMLSHLGCYQGGMIFPLDTGQGESEEEIVEGVNKEDIICKNAYLTEEEMKVNARYIYDFLSAAGWSHNAICGMFGNMQYESTFSPTIWLNCKENSAAVGLSQWNPSKDYLKWAKDNGLDPFDIDVQLNRILLEADGTIHHWQGFRHEANMSFEDYTRSKKSVEYLSEIYLRCYERPEITEKKITERANAAIEWSNFFLE